ncbi:hypothetical protein [uncultured Akkermansia sp.]|uniref:hypothetical protein n=1 Tax=uncultured Akkermansia sp. TaxID=512294 RepID=UPI00259B8CEA|nr:hypothetical protein [uncultured Akkermansia sp.]
MTTYQHLIDRGPYKGMVETLTDNPHPSKTARCYMCAEPLKASTSWMSLVGDHQNGVFTVRFLCPLCARERLNGIPDEAERCWNYTQAAQSEPRITKILAYLTYLIFWCVLVSAGGTFLFLIFLLLKNLF